MTLTYKNERFILLSSYVERMVPKEAGFRWDPKLRAWWTDRGAVARKLERWADDEAKAQLAETNKEIELSKKADIDIEIPAPEGCEYLGYQKAGIAYAIKRQGVLIGDEMGLGKTIQALGVINAIPEIENVLIICPASLRLNWAREAEKWIVRKMGINVITSKWVKTMDGINIVNYDIIGRIDKSREWDLVVCDEAHYMKNKKALRTKQIMGYREPRKSEWAIEPIKAKRRMLLTGTPIVNRPIELHSLISYLDPQTWGNFFWYAKRYCDAHNNGYGWDFSGARNLDELQESLRSTVMIRRLKKDVLKELPEKRRQVIEIPANGCSGLVEKEARAYAAMQDRISGLQAALELARAGSDDEYAAAVENLGEASSAAFSEISRIRHETAMAKVPKVIEHVLDVLDDVESLVIMAHHHDVVASIRAGLAQKKIKSAVLTGETKMEDRQKAVDDFQSGQVRVFIGTIRAAGVGITLTKASTVVFAELDWVPGNVSQAEDRLHRIGQEESVLVQHLVLEGSIDAVMAKTIVSKQAIIDQALDVMIRKEPILPMKEKRETSTRSQLKAMAEDLTPEEIRQIHIDLKTLAGDDTDFANIRNGVGFNKIDARIGHDLAGMGCLTKMQAALGKKILHKYKGQLGRGA